MKHDLTTQEGRKDAIKELHDNAVNDFKRTIKGMSENTMLKLWDGGIQIGIKNTDPESKQFGYFAFASDINLYSNDDYFDKKNNKKPTMNLGSAGEFTPEDKASYYRTVHAALLLMKWDKTVALIYKHTGKYKDLKKKIEIANP